MFNKFEFSFQYFICYMKYKKKINVDNIDKLHKKKIDNILVNVDLNTKEVFIKNLLSKYHDKFYEESYPFLDKIKWIIHQNNIILNTREEQYMLLLEERIFSKIRTLKILDTHYPLNNSENLYARYSKGKTFIKRGNFFRIIRRGKLLITNKQVILQTPNNVANLEFNYSKMRCIQYTKYGFIFKYKKDVFLLRAHDQKTLCNFIGRFITKNHNKNRK